MNIVIPIAGEGSRFKVDGYDLPKPLIEIQGDPMIKRAVRTLGFKGKYIFIIRETAGDGRLDTLLRSLVDLDHVEGVEVIKIQSLTDGPSCTALEAKPIINSSEPLVIANCDQIMWWDGREVQNALENSSYAGILVTYYSTTTKNSYVKINRKGQVLEVREKEVISDISTNGVHFWARGEYFVDAAQLDIELDQRAINGEFYIAPTYNNMINKGLKVGIYHIPNFQHHAIGTPDDLREYIRNESN